jgi:DNA processing protein
LDAWRADGISTLAYSDDRYPERLAQIPAAPPLLFFRGELIRADRSGVAIIGTRAPTGSGVRMAGQLASALVEAGRVVISGLAAGIDTAAHTAALAAGGRSIAVLGNGLHHVYPSANAALQARLQVLVSQFWPEQGPRRETFPKRNAVMSGISAATVIVEAGQRSGARIQARQAIAQGRPLFLMAPLLSQAWARTLAPQAGVRVIDVPDDLIAALGTWTA